MFLKKNCTKALVRFSSKNNKAELKITVLAFLKAYRDILCDSYCQEISKGIFEPIQEFLREIYGAEISQGMISKITDKILPEVNEWQNRPFDRIYPVIFFDGIVFNSRKDNNTNL